MSKKSDTRAPKSTSSKAGGMIGRIRAAFLSALAPLISFAKQNRSITLAATLGLVLIITGIFAVAFYNNTEETPTTDTQTEEVVEIELVDTMTASVSYAQGNVQYRTEGDWQDVETDLAIQPGMSVRTIGATSRAIVTFEDGSILRLDASSEIDFQTLTKTRVLIVQTSGYAYNRVVSNAERSYIVQTANAQFEAQGTAFRTIASGDEEAVEVFDDSVKETSINKEAFEGEKIIVVSAVDPTKNDTVEKLDLSLIHI